MAVKPFALNKRQALYGLHTPTKCTVPYWMLVVW